jgi:hypothetical protein
LVPGVSAAALVLVDRVGMASVLFLRLAAPLEDPAEPRPFRQGPKRLHYAVGMQGTVRISQGSQCRVCCEQTSRFSCRFVPLSTETAWGKTKKQKFLTATLHRPRARFAPGQTKRLTQGSCEMRLQTAQGSLKLFTNGCVTRGMGGNRFFTRDAPIPMGDSQWVAGTMHTKCGMKSEPGFQEGCATNRAGQLGEKGVAAGCSRRRPLLFLGPARA